MDRNGNTGWTVEKVVMVRNTTKEFVDLVETSFGVRMTKKTKGAALYDVSLMCSTLLVGFY